MGALVVALLANLYARIFRQPASVPLVPGYGAAKAAIVQMTKNMGVAWAKDNVRVNAVAPGLVESNMTAVMKGVAALEQPPEKP